MWDTGSLNSTQFMLQQFIRFPEIDEITDFNESSASNASLCEIHIPYITCVTEEHESSCSWARWLQGRQDTIAIITRVDLYPNADRSVLWSAGVRYSDTSLGEDTQVQPLVQCWVCHHCFVDLWEMKSIWSKHLILVWLFTFGFNYMFYNYILSFFVTENQT